MTTIDWTLYYDRTPTIMERIASLFGRTVDIEESIDVAIVVDHAESVPGSYSFNAASDVDYHGWDELDWHCEIDGEEAPAWVEGIASDSADAITEALWDAINDDADDQWGDEHLAYGLDY